jgi:predicted O-methyltransferase YrrM
MPATQNPTTGYLEEAPAIVAATTHAHEIGVPAIPVSVGSTLRLLARAVAATHVVELGTGAGVATLWLLEGMAPEGTLTTIDSEAEHHRLAKEAVAASGHAAARTRFITGRAREVLPRLADGAYDLVWCAEGVPEYADYLTAAVRLVRPGGLVVFNQAVGRAADPAARDGQSVALRQLREQLIEDARLLPAVLPGAEGVVAALRLPDGG